MAAKFPFLLLTDENTGVTDTDIHRTSIYRAMHTRRAVKFIKICELKQNKIRSLCAICVIGFRAQFLPRDEYA